MAIGSNQQMSVIFNQVGQKILVLNNQNFVLDNTSETDPDIIVRVYENSATTNLVTGQDYTVTYEQLSPGVSSGAGEWTITVTLTDPIATGQTIVVMSNIPLGNNFIANGEQINAAVLQNNLDAMSQQIIQLTQTVTGQTPPEYSSITLLPSDLTILSSSVRKELGQTGFDVRLSSTVVIADNESLFQIDNNTFYPTNDVYSQFGGWVTATDSGRFNFTVSTQGVISILSIDGGLIEIPVNATLILQAFWGSEGFLSYTSTNSVASSIIYQPSANNPSTNVQSAITYNSDAIATFEGDFQIVQDEVAQANADIATLQTQIVQTNANVATNTSNIATLQTQIVQTNANVATNTSNIAANTGAIAANTISIESNSANILAANAAITVNANAISTLQTSVATNTNDIATNTTAITTKADKINGATQITDPTAYPNLGTAANDVQSAINSATNVTSGAFQVQLNELKELFETQVKASISITPAIVAGNTSDNIIVLVETTPVPTGIVVNGKIEVPLTATVGNSINVTFVLYSTGAVSATSTVFLYNETQNIGLTNAIPLTVNNTVYQGVFLVVAPGNPPTVGRVQPGDVISFRADNTSVTPYNIDANSTLLIDNVSTSITTTNTNNVLTTGVTNYADGTALTTVLNNAIASMTNAGIDINTNTTNIANLTTEVATNTADIAALQGIASGLPWSYAVSANTGIPPIPAGASLSLNLTSQVLSTPSLSPISGTNLTVPASGYYLITLDAFITSSAGSNVSLCNAFPVLTSTNLGSLFWGVKNGTTTLKSYSSGFSWLTPQYYTTPYSAVLTSNTFVVYLYATLPVQIFVLNNTTSQITTATNFNLSLTQVNPAAV